MSDNWSWIDRFILFLILVVLIAIYFLGAKELEEARRRSSTSVPTTTVGVYTPATQ